MRQDEYKNYRATEARLYEYRTKAARLEILELERKHILERILPSVGVAQYGEHVGRASDSLTGPEQWGEQRMKDGKRLYVINGEIRDIKKAQHEIYYSMSSLFVSESRIINAIYFEGLTIERTAEFCHCSDKTVKNIRYSAIRKVGAVLFGE